jgi:hypothetical protein
MHIILILLVIWFIWSIIGKLIRQNRQSNTMLTILHNKNELNSFVDTLTVSLGEAADRYDRIDILTARLPRYLSLVTGKPLQQCEKWVEKNPKNVEMLERTMYSDPNYLRKAMAEIDKLFSR